MVTSWLEMDLCSVVSYNLDKEKVAHKILKKVTRDVKRDLYSGSEAAYSALVTIEEEPIIVD